MGLFLTGQPNSQDVQDFLFKKITMGIKIDNRVNQGRYKKGIQRADRKNYWLRLVRLQFRVRGGSPKSPKIHTPSC